MRLLNKRVKFDYQILETIEAGVALKGDDIKLLREGKINLKGAYAKIMGGEAYLMLATMPTRKLLLHKDQIRDLEAKTKAKRLTIVPTKLYTKGHLVKAELALAKSKKKFEKKEAIKKRDLEREL